MWRETAIVEVEILSREPTSLSVSLGARFEPGTFRLQRRNATHGRANSDSQCVTNHSLRN